MLADAIVEATETGSTLRANRLRIIDTVMESATQFVANAGGVATTPGSGPSSRTSRMLLRAAIAAQGRVGLMLNVRHADLPDVLALLPALRRPDDLAAGRRGLGCPEHDRRGARPCAISSRV